MALIDARLKIVPFYQHITDVSQLYQFIGRTKQFKILSRADMVFYTSRVELQLSSHPRTDSYTILDMGISCHRTERQLPSLVRVSSSSLPPFHSLESLDIYEVRKSAAHNPRDAETARWREFYAPSLLSSNGRVAHTKKAFLRRASVIEQFVAARECSGHPVATHNWERWRRCSASQKCTHAPRFPPH